MGPGFAARGGITAALMARKGITGAKNCLEGECGLFPLYHQGKYDPKVLTEDLGKVFKGINVQAKPYPCCKGTHDFVDATLSLVNKQNLKPEDIQEITIFAHGQANLSQPVEVKSHPRNLVDSQFSIPWAVAAGISRRRAAIADFTEEAIKSADILNICDKIKVDMDPPPDAQTKLKVITRQGQIHYGKIEAATNSAKTLLPFSHYERKFQDCASYAVKKLPEENLRKIIEAVKNLEQLDDIQEIIQWLS
jgi:2-methylcitrate dehydratase PrpD